MAHSPRPPTFQTTQSRVSCLCFCVAKPSISPMQRTRMKTRKPFSKFFSDFRLSCKCNLFKYTTKQPTEDKDQAPPVCLYRKEQRHNRTFPHTRTRVPVCPQGQGSSFSHFIVQLSETQTFSEKVTDCLAGASSLGRR